MSTECDDLRAGNMKYGKMTCKYSKKCAMCPGIAPVLYAFITASHPSGSIGVGTSKKGGSRFYMRLPLNSLPSNPQRKTGRGSASAEAREAAR